MLQREKCEKIIYTTIQKVGMLYKEDPSTMNSDNDLFFKYVIRWHGYSERCCLADVFRDKDVPSFATITRSGRQLRRLWNYKADPVVEEMRKENEVAFANCFGR